MSRLPRVLVAAGALLLLAVWIGSGSLVTSLVVVALVGGLGALAAVGFVTATRPPRPTATTATTAVPTTDLDHVPSAGDRVRRALRRLLARPWVRGDALVRAATARLASEDALVFTPRGQRVAAPHVWVEWHTADLAEVAERWPLDVLAQELADGYLERAGARSVRRLTDRTWVHLLDGPDVPVGRVIVTAAFSRPQHAPVASACSPSSGPALPGPAPRTFGVLVAESPGTRDIVLADRPLTVGRDPRADAVVDHPGVSWRHLTVARRDATTWVVTDAGSTNGTVIADARATAPTTVRAGDVVALGADGPHYRLALRSTTGPVGGPADRQDRQRGPDGTRLEVA